MRWDIVGPWGFHTARGKRKPPRDLGEATQCIWRRVDCEIAPEPVDGTEFLAHWEQVLWWSLSPRIPKLYGDDRSPVPWEVISGILTECQHYGLCSLGGPGTPQEVYGFWEEERDVNLILTVTSDPSTVSPQDCLNQFQGCLRVIGASGKPFRQKAMFAVGEVDIKIDMGIFGSADVGQTYGEQWQRQCFRVWGYCRMTQIIDVFEAAREMQEYLAERLFFKIEGKDFVVMPTRD